jgi:ParB family transcriptional regulator, chromosome partitioning protein
MEIAVAFHRLADEHGLSHEQIAERTGKDRSTITNFLRLLRLSSFVQNQLISGTVTVGHARALLNIPDEQEQANLCRKIIDAQLSVRETEKLVKTLTTSPGQSAGKEKGDAPKLDPNIRAALDEMEMALGTRVRMVPKSDKAGRLEIQYYSQDDLDRIYSVIVKQ